MARRKIVGQRGATNQSGVNNDAWGRKKKQMTTLTRAKGNTSAFRGNKTMKAIILDQKKQSGRSAKAFIHNHYSHGNLGGAVVSSVKGNKNFKNVKLIFGDPKNPKGGAKVYDIGLRDARDVKGYLNSVKAMLHDKEYLKLMKETGTQPMAHAMELANKILGLQVGKMGTKIGNDFVSATTYDKKGKVVSVTKGTRGPHQAGGGSTGQQVGQVLTGNQTFNQPTIIGGVEKMTKSEFKNLDLTNINAEDWARMGRKDGKKGLSGQQFLAIAKMSSPAFQADKANEFAKKMETKAKNISRGIGIAGKAIGGVGRGLASGYNKGWGSR